MSSELLFTCPTTKQRARTGIETDIRTLSATLGGKLTVDCPLCGQPHEISVRDVYIESEVKGPLAR